MKTYWDLTDAEKANLTREQVEQFVAAELMTHGVVKVEPPKYEDEPIAPRSDATCFRIRERDKHNAFDVAFATVEQAQAFLKLNPIAVDSIWTGGRSVPFTRPLENAEIYQAETFSKAQVDASRATIEMSAKAKERNEVLAREYEKELRAQQEVLEGMWSDWREQQAKAARLRRVIDTFADYKTTAGDSDLAAKFLHKAFPSAIIDEAASWYGVEIPDPTAAVEMPA